MRVAYINKGPATDIVMEEAQRRLLAAGNELKNRIKANLRQAISNSFNRPVYKTGKYAGKWWTARDAGELMHSVRVVSKDSESVAGHRNIRIIAGNSKAYWATIYEYTLNPARGHKFFRPALASARSSMRRILENG